jgi:hypothetical protein
MAKVMIICPTTGKTVATGFAMTREAFESPTFHIARESTDCFACGRSHEWSTKDAFLDGSPMQLQESRSLQN